MMLCNKLGYKLYSCKAGLAKGRKHKYLRLGTLQECTAIIKWLSTDLLKYAETKIKLFKLTITAWNLDQRYAS